MANRIIIDVQDDTSIDRALDAVMLVVQMGKISVTSKGIKHYCWYSNFKNGVAVYTRTKKKNQTSDSFFVRTES